MAGQKSGCSSSITIPSILSLTVGAIIVFTSSPNISSISLSSLHAILSQPSLIDFLTIQALITDATFIFLISFLILCNYDHSARWIACNQSFPYSYSPSWNFGPRSLDFQLLIFEIFHIGWISRTIHMLGIILEEGLWALVVTLTFGKWGLLVLSAIMLAQAVSYNDLWVSLGVILANTIVTGTVWLAVQVIASQFYGFNVIDILSIVKGLLFWTVTLRTLSHILEPLPPTYRPEVECFDNNFGIVGWRLCLSDLPRAMWLVILGNVSEFGAGMPGRLFNVVVYKCMHKVGFRSQTGLLDVIESKKQAWKVIEYGWMAHPETARMYQWASSSGSDRLLDLDEKTTDTEIV